MISCQNITKSYGRKKVLDGVSFTVARGEIVGFLGKNGAGKTTLMRVLTSFFPPDSGTAVVAGKDVVKESMAVRRGIGYLPENPPLYPSMTVKDYLTFAARLKDVPFQAIRRERARVLNECQLESVQHVLIGELSKGYKQRVGIAQAVIHNPKVLILDEPTNGLDPEQILHVRRLIKNVEASRTVILSTHILSEIEKLAKRVLIIKEGRIIADNLLHELIAGSREAAKIFVRARAVPLLIEQALTNAEGVTLIRMESEDEDITLLLEVRDKQDYGAFIQHVLKGSGHILEIRSVKNNLEDIFLRRISDG